MTVLLSYLKTAGAHAELGEWALTVNPFDVEGQAAAIGRALELDPAERRARLEAIREHVRTHDLNRWTDTPWRLWIESLRRRAVRIGDRMGELSHVSETGMCTWWTSVVSRCHVAAPWPVRPCGWPRRRRGRLRELPEG